MKQTSLQWMLVQCCFHDFMSQQFRKKNVVLMPCIGYRTSTSEPTAVNLRFGKRIKQTWKDTIKSNRKHRGKYWINWLDITRYDFSFFITFLILSVTASNDVSFDVVFGTLLRHQNSKLTSKKRRQYALSQSTSSLIESYVLLLDTDKQLDVFRTIFHVILIVNFFNFFSI